MSPHPGNVRIQADTISRTTPQLTDDRRFAAPTPMIAVVFVWVVLTGIPNVEETKRQVTAAKSAENP